MPFLEGQPMNGWLWTWMRREPILLMFMLGLLTSNLVAMSCCSMNCVGILSMDLGTKSGRNSIVAMKPNTHSNVGD